MPQRHPSAAAPAAPDERVRPYLNYLYAAAMTGKPSSAQIAISAAIAGAHFEKGAACFTYAQLAARASCTKRNAIRCIGRLLAAGAIRLVGVGEKGGNVYEPALELGERHHAAWTAWKTEWREGARREFPSIV
ncbi:hypothetical protein [Ensifer soli]|uniref:hypothetical protein n=1 Tax=Ciceribacter sp. sgz301302 TaxID=3342379 RepID=UPI0035B83B52